MSDFELHSGSFLLATPALNNGYFKDCIIFVVEHTPMSSWGLVINQPAHLPLDEVFNRNPKLQRQKIIPRRPLHTFFFGGPVQSTTPFQKLSVTILEAHQSVFDKPLELAPNVFISRIPLEMPLPVGRLVTPANTTSRIFFGYTGWAENQLEQEVADGAWEIQNTPPIEVFSHNRDEMALTPSIFREAYSAN